ncbi:MAG: hypothetical protein EBV19_11385 [Flavobacteriia bacterium]|nr:hypothetical protein [Flavobacteriia bacterium]
METSKNNDWSKRDIGALWKREGQNQKYLSGYVKVDELGLEREVKIVVFSNKNKNNNDKAPDYRIYVSKPLEKSEPSNKTSIQNEKKVKQTVATQKNKPNDSEEEELL